MKIIYADTLVLTNTLVDYLLLLAAGKLCALPLRRGRMALGALWGGAYSLLDAVFPGFFGLWTVKLLAGAAAVFLAYGPDRKLSRALAAFYAVAAAFGGAVHAGATLRGEPVGAGLPVSLPVLLLSFALCYTAVTLAFRHIGRKAQRQILPVSVRLGEKTASFSALLDSGNELIDPVSGCGVLIASAEALSPLFSRPDRLRLSAPDALEHLARAELRGKSRLLPCSCVASAHTLLLCFRPDTLEVAGKLRRDLLIGVSPEILSPDGTYQAIISE